MQLNLLIVLLLKQHVILLLEVHKMQIKLDSIKNLNSSHNSYIILEEVNSLIYLVNHQIKLS